MLSGPAASGSGLQFTDPTSSSPALDSLNFPPSPHNPAADKEALRRQAAESMKAVELRSLNLLEGGLAMGKAVRGVPMAAAKGFVGPGVPMGATLLAGTVPMPNGIPAAPPQLVPPPQQLPQQSAVAPAQQGAQPPPPAVHHVALPLKPQAHPAVAVAASGVPLAVPAPTAVVPLAGPAAPPAPHIGMQAPSLAPGAVLVPPPPTTGP